MTKKYLKSGNHVLSRKNILEKILFFSFIFPHHLDCFHKRLIPLDKISRSINKGGIIFPLRIKVKIKSVPNYKIIQ